MSPAMPGFDRDDCRRWPAWLWGGVVSLAMAAYYAVFYFPPRLVGSNDPDRFYHLGLSKLIAAHGLLKSLPQVEDLGWGLYFPDKEFLFHALTGGAYWLAGPLGTLMVVPLLGIAIVACLYAPLSRVLPPWQAALLVLIACLLSPVFIFRITLLRPHLLAILFICMLIVAMLRGRPWLAFVATAGFALSYHALYVPLIVITAAAVTPWPDRALARRCWLLASVGLVVGTLVNPYFPSNVVMSWVHLKIALGIGLPPGLRSGFELVPIDMSDYLKQFSFPLLTLLAAIVFLLRHRLWRSPESAPFWFLLALTTVMVGLSLKSVRAIEYSVPCSILLAGYCLAKTPRLRWFAIAGVVLAAIQGPGASVYYRDIWSQPQGGLTGWYLNAINLLPPEAAGKKVFNCEWVSGSYLLFARPDVRFVDLLEPAFLWQKSHSQYIARERLLAGTVEKPYAALRDGFKADYVLCGMATLNRQMLADPVHFQELTGDQPTDPLRVFRVRD